MTEIIPNSPSGRQLADSGIALAQQHADATVSAWSERIMLEFDAWLMNQDTAFAVEDFRAHIEVRRPELIPPSPNAWGAVGRRPPAAAWWRLLVTAPRAALLPAITRSVYSGGLHEHQDHDHGV